MSGSVYKIRCPHCRHAIRVRNSVEQHPLLRSMYLQCTNVNCGATYRAGMEITHLMSPAADPNPAIELPMADAAIRRAAVERENAKQVDIDDILQDELAVE
ncbi:ogr/Delta-like zinc finger family protein [Neptuniibacter sp. CAU 1671]|uniref:ogr/Delta-like zinc finger family protein n=1 Tax=Neptuniibacter sp. CAU 1671 TaxID=3032593 RepID=UPI0023DCD056|nr:ogr/Delta-like zinc finger family protein [Neptuniibacter sp. CAU 1671]MDF2180972.1 ogr/Delta-like zinc finger family protein [Neptuniibacter sp. CAU 1671]